jgi:protein involved in polysaccharide export with SLBB domain
VLIRREVLNETGGYDPDLVGGEDPELSQRLRQAGWSIRHIDVAMTTHDLAMRSARQYWRRAFRTGYAYAAVAFRHGFKKAAFWRYELGRILVRGGAGLALIVTGLAAATFTPAIGALITGLGLTLVFYPRLFRVGHFRRTKNLNTRDARKYAWHCALVVVPEFFGVTRFVAGHIVNRPLRNRTHRTRLLARLTGLAFKATSLAAAGLLSACSTKFVPGAHELTGANLALPKEEMNVGNVFEQEATKEKQTFASENEIARFSNSVPEEYRVGPGDKMTILVRNRPEASVDSVTVSPDGLVAVPRVGILTVKNRTAEQITAEVRSRLAEYYAEPDVTVILNEYNNNKAFVLGRVSNPGLVNFTGQGNLLEAISMAGGLPVVAEDAFLSRAMIFRGNDMVIWVDLREILTNGNIAMNPKLRNNDIVFIPESDDELVYVMGAVESPGAVKLKTELSLLDAVMASGGPTVDAKLANVYLIRYTGSRGYVQQIRIDHFLQRADLRQDYLLKDGDIVYVSTKSIEKMSYVLSKFNPALRYVDLAVLSSL